MSDKRQISGATKISLLYSHYFDKFQLVIITSKIEGDICIFFLDGNLDTATAVPAGQQIQTDLRDYKKAIFDLSKTAYVSSAGLRVFLVTAKKLKAEGGEIRLCNANETVDEILTISGFKTILTVNADVAEATSELQG